MAFVNNEKKEINCKIVYHGPGFSGKSSNLHYIYQKLSADQKGQFTSLSTEMGGRGVQYILQSKAISKVTELNLSNNPLDATACHALSRPSILPELKVLFLHGCGLHDSDVEQFLSSTTLPPLHNLALSGNQLTLHSVQKIANNPCFSELEELDICSNLFDEKDAHPILDASPFLTRIKRRCL